MSTAIEPAPTKRRRDLVLTREEAAECLGISLQSFKRHVQPHLRVVHVGRRVLVPSASLYDFVEGAQ